MKTYLFPNPVSKGIFTDAIDVFEALSNLGISDFYGRYYELQSDGSWEQCYHF